MRADYAVCDLAAAAKGEGPRTWYLGGYDQRLSSYLQDKSRFFFIGNFVPYKEKPSGGSHCGGMELCRSCDPPQAGNLASEILFSMREKYIFQI